MKLDISKPLLDLNDRCAQEVRALLDRQGVFVLDLMASPGAGKTSTILATIAQLRERFRIAVIEGDIASDVDSLRIKEQGIPAVQINTGGACHLESQMIRRALDVLDLETLDLIIIENVGNLVCPTDFYLGENAKVMILSVPEGHDKPLKYPGIFQVSSAVILNKIDTLPVFDFDEQAFRRSVGQLNPTAPVFALSATGGQGVEEWAAWLAERAAGIPKWGLSSLTPSVIPSVAPAGCAAEESSTAEQPTAPEMLGVVEPYERQQVAKDVRREGVSDT